MKRFKPSIRVSLVSSAESAAFFRSNLVNLWASKEIALSVQSLRYSIRK